MAGRLGMRESREGEREGRPLRLSRDRSRRGMSGLGLLLSTAAGAPPLASSSVRREGAFCGGGGASFSLAPPAAALRFSRLSSISDSRIIWRRVAAEARSETETQASEEAVLE